MNTKRSYINDNFRISQEQFDCGWTMPCAHYHNACEIYVLKSGQRIVSFENEEFTVNAHEVTLFDSNVHHKSRGDAAFSGICIHFSKWYLDFFFTEAAVNDLMQCFNEKIIALNDDDFNTVCKIADDFVYGDNSNFVILSVILNILNKSAKTNNPPVSVPQKKLAECIISYADENYAFIRSISDISEQFGVSEGYVHKIFRERLSTTPKHYINRLRIKNVCHCLKQSNRSVKAIAAESGFDCYAHFLRVFKAETGLTPSEYRKKAAD